MKHSGIIFLSITLLFSFFTVSPVIVARAINCPANTVPAIDPGHRGLCANSNQTKYYNPITDINNGTGSDGSASSNSKNQPLDPCAGTPSGRHQECMDAHNDPNTDHKYNADPCLSFHSQNYVKEDGNPVYNTDRCKQARVKHDCDGKKSDGYVYIRAFGADSSGACVTFLGFSKSIIDYSLVIASIVCAFMFLQGGFKYTISRGNPNALFEARDQILHASLGLVLLATAYIIVLFLQGSFGYLGIDLVGPFGQVFGH